MTVRHFLTLMDLGRDELHALIYRGIEIKQAMQAGQVYQPLQNRTLAMIFDKSSTRTRISFEVAMTQFGGSAIFLSPGSTQLGRGEPVEDTARVMSRMVDAVVIRTSSHSMVETFAAHSEIPVINGLTDSFHPCQLLADVQTYLELRGDINGRRVAWVGDGNNMCHSWINAARQFQFELAIATPHQYRPDATRMDMAGDVVTLSDDPEVAVRDADIVVTDTWASMGQESEKERRSEAFRRFRVTQRLMQQAKSDALFMHCLPAYRDHEVTAEVIDGPQSVVWAQAENRLHAQKALLELLLLAQR
jgi:ornithine carbamoyltransferase